MVNPNEAGIFSWQGNNPAPEPFIQHPTAPMSRIFQRLLFCTALVFSGLTAGAVAPDTATVSFHSYGLVRGGGDAPRAIVAQRWHIEYITVAGCLVTEGLIDSARRHNAATEAILVRRHGKDWQKRFDADVASEAKRQKAITQRLDSSAEIRTLRSRLRKDSNTPWYLFAFDEKAKLYTVTVKAWNEKAGDYKTYYLLTAGIQRWELRKVG
jgi:hypothetical protein